MNMARTIKLFFILIVLLSVSCAKSSSKSAVSDLIQNKPLTEENVLIVLDKLALTNLDTEDYKLEEIASIISAVNEPELLFNLILKSQERSRNIPADGKCLSCDRYEIAIVLSLERLSALKSEDSIRYLVKLVEIKAFQGHAHRSEILLENVSSIGKPALTYLKKLKDNYLAQKAIECIENNEPCH